MPSRDLYWMTKAIEEARYGLGLTSPNPVVGAVLCDRGQLLAKGHHARAGSRHAEIECLRHLNSKVSRTATLYVTLEPCSTKGRTGRCTDAIVAAGVRRVVVGAIDPNPEHEGRGIEVLRGEGIEVVAGILADECTRLNESYNKWIRTGLPFVIAKCGMSLDGRLTRPPGESPWLTGVAARKQSHQLRAHVDAVLIGAETLRTDNPRLTARGIRGARQPWRVILSRSGRLPRESHVFRDAFAAKTLVLKGLSLPQALEELGRREITSVLIEGGGDILGQAADAGLIDKVHLYLAPLFTGGPIVAYAGNGADSTSSAARLDRVGYEQIGSDVCVTGYPLFPGNANNAGNFPSKREFNQQLTKETK